MKELNANQLENLEGGKFFGRTVSCGQPYSIEPGSCYKNCVVTFQVFWLETYNSGSNYIGITCEAAGNL
ncbi:hypothetical protein [Polaribacter sp.]|uniref:hypothetical protein n=1 Tax=Polaribacter sp. TaxID=1920175 RepID=UPI004047D213